MCNLFGNSLTDRSKSDIFNSSSDPRSISVVVATYSLEGNIGAYVRLPFGLDDKFSIFNWLLYTVCGKRGQVMSGDDRKRGICVWP